MTPASLIEIFASAQGEGPEIGRRTVFVRFGGCDLRCRWCDSPGTWGTTAVCRVEEAMGTGRFLEIRNPVGPAQVAEWVDRLAPSPRAWVSLTGGEPLLQPDALESLVDELSKRGRRLYLETHGLHAEALQRVAPRIDLISMDWKFTSDVAWAKGRDPGEGAQASDVGFHAAHEAFLRVALSTRQPGSSQSLYVKAVLTPSTRVEEFDEMLDRIAAVSPEIPLVLQPVTPTGGVREMPSAEALLEWLARAETRLADVRLIPQTHPIYGAL